MKALFITDLHLRARNPRWRTGSYLDDILDKLRVAVELADERDCDCLILGGDLVDSPSVSIWAVNQAVDILTKAEAKVICIWGQHDEVGNTPEGVLRSPASLFGRTFGGYTVPTYHTKLKRTGEMLIHVNYHADIEDGLRKNGIPWSGIAMVHAMITEKAVPWDHVLIGEIETDAQVVLSGDYHAGFPPQEHNGTWFANPGALARPAISDRYRIPQAAFVDTNLLPDCPIEFVPLPHRPAAEAFDLSTYEESLEVQQEHVEYTKMLAQIEAGGHSSWEAMFEAVRAEGDVDEEILEEAYERCQQVAQT